jgi:hypothetical protein
LANKIDLVSELSRIDINQSAIASFQSKLQRSIESAFKNVDLNKLDVNNKKLVADLNQLVGALRQIPSEIKRIQTATNAVTAEFNSKTGRYQVGNSFITNDLAKEGLSQKAIETAKKIAAEELKRQSLQKETLSLIKNELSESEKLITSSQKAKNNSNEYNALLQRRATLLKQINELESKSVTSQRLSGIRSVANNANFDPVRQQNSFLSVTQDQANKLNQVSLQNARSSARKYAQEVERELKSALLREDPAARLLEQRLQRIRRIQSILQNPSSNVDTGRLDKITDFFRGSREEILSKRIDSKVLQKAALENDKLAKGIDKTREGFSKFGDQIGLAVKRYGAFLTGTAGLFVVINAFRTATEEALKFEKAQTRLSQILAVPRGNVSGITSVARGQSLSTGVSTTETLQGVDILAQAGFQKIDQLSFAAEKLSKIPLAATFDGIDRTADGLIAIFRQFNFELNDTSEIFDKVNRVAADYAVEVKDIFDGVKRGGAVFVEAGGNFDDFLKYFTLLRDRSRESSETIGSFFKSIGFRLFRPENEQILKNLGVTGNTIQDRLSGTAGAFERQFGSNLNGNPEAIRLAQQLAGVYQGGRFLNLLSAISGDRGKFERSIDQSSGSFESETAKRAGDIGVSFQRLQAAINNFVAEFTNNNALRNLFKFFADASEQLSKFSSTLAPVVALLAGAGAVAALPAIGRASISAANRLGFVTRGSSRRQAESLLPDQYINGVLDNDRILSRQRLEESIFADSILGRRDSRRSTAQQRGFGRARSALFVNTGIGGNNGFRLGARGLSGAGGIIAGLGSQIIDDNFLQDTTVGNVSQRREAIRSNRNFSGISSVLSGAAAGATVGALIGGPVGIAVGGVIGVGTALLGLAKASKEAKKELDELNASEAKSNFSANLRGSANAQQRFNSVLQFRFESLKGLDFKANPEEIVNRTNNVLRNNNVQKSLQEFVRTTISRGGTTSDARKAIFEGFELKQIGAGGGDLKEIFKLINNVFDSVAGAQSKNFKQNLKQIEANFIDLTNFFNSSVTSLVSEISLNKENLLQRNELLTSNIPSIRGEFEPASLNLSGKNLLNAISSNASILQGTGIDQQQVAVFKQISDGIDSRINELKTILSNPDNLKNASRAALDFVNNTSEGRTPLNTFVDPGTERIGQIISELQITTGKKIKSEDFINAFNSGGVNGISELANQQLNGVVEVIRASIASVNDSFNKIQESVNRFNERLIDSSNKVFEFSNQINDIRKTGQLSSINNLTAVGNLSDQQSLTATLKVLSDAFNANRVGTSSIGFENRINANNAIIGRTGSNLSVQNTSLLDQEKINSAIRDNALTYNEINQALQAYNTQLDLLTQGTGLLIQSYQQQRSELINFGRENLSASNQSGGKDSLNLDLLQQLGSALGGGRSSFGNINRNAGGQERFRQVLNRFNPEQEQKLLETLQRIPDIKGSPFEGARRTVEDAFLNRGARDLSRQAAAFTGGNADQFFSTFKQALEAQRKEILNRNEQEKELRDKQLKLVTLQLKESEQQGKDAKLAIENSTAMLTSILNFSKDGSTALESVKVAAEQLSNFVKGFTGGNGGIVTEIKVSPIQVDLNIINGSIFKELIRNNNNNIADAIATAIEKATGTRPNTESIPVPGTE